MRHALLTLRQAPSGCCRRAASPSLSDAACVPRRDANGCVHGIANLAVAPQAARRLCWPEVLARGDAACHCSASTPTRMTTPPDTRLPRASSGSAVGLRPDRQSDPDSDRGSRHSHMLIGLWIHPVIVKRNATCIVDCQSLAQTSKGTSDRYYLE